MKRICLLFSILVFISSCKWYDPVEETPLNTLSSLTPISLLNFSSFASGEAAVFTGILTQQVSGINGKMLSIEQYNLLPEYFNFSWDVCYLAVLSNLATIIEVASENHYGKYRGIAKVLMANTLGIATDLWGDIPYSESFGLVNNSLTPKYDSQESIYDSIFELLDEAIADLTAYGNDFHPKDDDLFFNGDAQRWIRYANFLKLRYSLHIFNIDGGESIVEQLDNQMFLASGESFSINYSELFAVNPLSLVVSNYPGQIKASDLIVETLEQFDDPRLKAFFRKNSEGNYIGSYPGEANQSASNLSDTIVGHSAKVILGSFTEQMFIEAEYYFRKGRDEESFFAFGEAVKSSLLDYGVFNDNWLKQYLEDVELSLEKIISAKHIALFLQVEVFADWRRTGYPELVPSFGNYTDEQFPRRFSYPQSEFLYNPNNIPTNVSIIDRVWWDI